MPPAPKISYALAWAFALAFGLIGIYMPFWQLVLRDRGLSPTKIGILLGIAPWFRVIVGPVVGRWADRFGRDGRWLQGCAGLLLIGYVGFAYAQSFGAYLGLMAIVGIGFAPVVPLIDRLTLHPGASELLGLRSYAPLGLAQLHLCQRYRWTARGLP